MPSQGFQKESTSLFGSTLSPGRLEDKIAAPRLVTLTILTHPDVRRVGDRVTLPQLTTGHPVEVSRLTPKLGPPVGGNRRPLSDKHLSRRPMILEPIAKTAQGLVIRRGEVATELEVDGAAVGQDCSVSQQQLETGVTIVLAKRVALLVHFFTMGQSSEVPPFDLVGDSSPLIQLRHEIHQVAPHSVAVLIHGETGTGKELVARAIHRASPRSVRPLVSVNMGALPPTLATAELFGSVRGGFTGAEKRIGVFERANGGTLFLDEIGETPEEVQVMLLRTLETQEIQPVGASHTKRVDVRVIAATDAALGSAIQEGRFRAPLLHRLAGYELQMPSLRERRDDIGRLLFYFLEQELDKIGQSHLLRSAAAKEQPWLPAPLVARLARYSWPGNVRQLRNAARRLVVGGLDGSAIALERIISMVLQEPAPSAHSLANTTSAKITAVPGANPKSRRPAKVYRAPHEVSDEELVSVLKAQRWNLKKAAETLGISRASLYVLIDRCQSLRRASNIEEQELKDCHRRHRGDLEAMSDELEVSRYALQHRLRQFGIKITQHG